MIRPITAGEHDSQKGSNDYGLDRTLRYHNERSSGGSFKHSDDPRCNWVQIDDVKDFEKLRDGHWEQEGKIIDVDEIPHQLTGAKVSAYFPETIFVPEIVPEITQQVQSLTKFGLAVAPATVETTAVDETNWATAWKKYYHPVQSPVS